MQLFTDFRMVLSFVNTLKDTVLIGAIFILIRLVKHAESIQLAIHSIASLTVKLNNLGPKTWLLTRQALFKNCRLLDHQKSFEIE